MKAFLFTILVTGSIGSAALAEVARPQRGLKTDPACTAALGQKTVQPGTPRDFARRLGDLPPGVLQFSVLRVIGGCSVATVRTGGMTFYVPDAPKLLALTPADAPSRR